MWAASLCRCAALRPLPSQLLAGSRSTLHRRLVERQLTTLRGNSKLGDNGFRVSRLTNFLKSNTMAVRLSTSAPNPKTPKVVGYWLLGCSGMVFTAVVLGGVTRLTESGLSMVTWRLLGERRPRGDAEWREEFAKYQQYPEFKYKNRDMTLAEFKWIWWMEFAHRSWGRLIGAAMFAPAAFFWARGYLNKGMKARVAAYCALVGVQGLMGWYMVKSGLEDRFQGPSDVPRVSQYRLAAHLGLAFLLYVGLLGGALRVLRPPPALAALAAQAAPGLRRTTALAHAVKGMAFLTALSGALVAGLDAGLVYNSFPKMGDRWLPRELLQLAPAARNLTENPVTVQFDHRILGTTTLALATALWATAGRKPLPAAARRLVHAVGIAAWMQVSLGILTLLHFVPTPLAASHQAGSLALLTLAAALTHELKLLRYIPK